MKKRRKLHGRTLLRTHPGLSSGRVAMLLECASVALARHHQPPTTFDGTDAGRNVTLRLEWSLPDDRTERSWADPGEATERAAELVAVVAVEAWRGLVVIERARRGTRVDYYVGRPGDDLETAVLLEVAGKDTGGLSVLLEEKCAQARQNPARLPAIAAVVRFARPRVMLQDV